MEKEKAMALRMPQNGDDAKIAEMVRDMGFEKCRPQHVRHFLTGGDSPTYGEAILEACSVLFRNRGLAERLVPVEMVLPTA